MRCTAVYVRVRACARARTHTRTHTHLARTPALSVVCIMMAVVIKPQPLPLPHPPYTVDTAADFLAFFLPVAVSSLRFSVFPMGCAPAARGVQDKAADNT